VEERPLKGLIIGGALTLGIPYVIGLALVAPAHFPNESHWLAVPVLGPWISMGARRTTCDISHDADFCGLADFGAEMIYIMDGIVQAAGATMLIVGVTVTRRRLVRSDLVSFDVTPMRVGLGYGLGANGNF
jgi:hypothetical protein